MGYRPHAKPRSQTVVGELKSAYGPSPIAPSRQRAEGALIIFAKAPIPGQVKTRLCPPLSPDEAASLHGSMVLDVLERSRATRREQRKTSATPAAFDRYLACAPSADHVFFKVLQEREGVHLIDQSGEDLGARLDHVSRSAFAKGYRRVVMVGTDSPSLPATIYGEAFTLLSSHDLVLGPALDGGYYLIGLTRPVPELFAGIPWSTDRVCAITRERAERLGLRMALLPTWRDLDTLDDLLAMIKESEARSQNRGPRTKPQSLALSPQPFYSARTAGVLRLLESRLRTRPVGQQDVSPGLGMSGAS